MKEVESESGGTDRGGRLSPAPALSHLEAGGRVHGERGPGESLIRKRKVPAFWNTSKNIATDVEFHLGFGMTKFFKCRSKTGHSLYCFFDSRQQYPK